MIYKIKITELAKVEIKNIANYIFINSFSKEKAEKVFNEIYSKIYSLSIFPEIYTRYNENYRVMTINKKYIISSKKSNNFSKLNKWVT